MAFEKGEPALAPQPSDLESLPLRGHIAYAVRAIHRALPLFVQGSGATDRVASCVFNSIYSAEGFCSSEHFEWSHDSMFRSILDAVENDKLSHYQKGITPAVLELLRALDIATNGNVISENILHATAVHAFNAASLAGDVLKMVSNEAAEAYDGACLIDFAALRDYFKGTSYPGPGQSIDAMDTGPLGGFWPDGIPEDMEDYWYVVHDPPGRFAINPPIVGIAWDPGVITEDEYAQLIVAIGDFFRKYGAEGIERIRQQGFGVTCDDGVLR